ncbi:hypothetical protein COU80_01740 [Candidatus Peregrinibacteria bacterium CG10_big_fil_rev_8_21_14_0_10_55_24]|nr:MAG: hypothetical protein COU80_01740 [Candidatus Peregrinibacteria bacterium CG10_big_fil_rev_8_21_14_0_10_55_24]
MADWHSVNRLSGTWYIEDEVNLQSSESDVYEFFIGDVHMQITRAQIRLYDALREIRGLLWPRIEALMDLGWEHDEAVAEARHTCCDQEHVSYLDAAAEIARLHASLESAEEQRRRLHEGEQKSTH